MIPFDSLSEAYARFRPRYPSRLLDGFARHCRDRRPLPRTILDVGCGTGISTRALRDAFGSGPSILGIEPSVGMIDAAISATDDPNTRYIQARAEELPARDESADVIFAAQAIQWFDRPAFYGEAARALAPTTGTLAICQNNRDWSGDAFLDAYESLLEEYSPGYTRGYRAIDLGCELRDLPWVGHVDITTERWTMTGSIDDFVGLAFSSTKMKAAAEANGLATMRVVVHELAQAYAIDGVVSVPYVCELYAAHSL